MIRLLVLVLAIISTLLGAGPTAAAEDAAPPALTVLTKHAPPFVFWQDREQPIGISIEIWERVAERIGVETRWERRDLEDLLTEIEEGRAPIGIAAITTTPPREKRMDFSHPYYTTGLGIAVTAGGGSSGWLNVFRNFFSLDFLSAIAALALVLALASVAAWFFERRHNDEFAGSSTASGLGNSFWWSAVTMTTVGYGDMAPKTRGGRVVALCWMFASVIIISSFTASITSSLTVGSLGLQITGPGDLPGARVGVIGNTTAAAWADAEVGAVRSFESLDEALTQLAAGRLDAVVHDRPLLRYAVNIADYDRVQVLEATFQRQDYAIALPDDSEYREAINVALQELLRDGTLTQIIDHHL